MTKKIPVGATIVHAYRFGFGQALVTLQAIWLPLVLYLAVIVPVLHRTALVLAASTVHDPSAASLFGPLLLMYPVAFILFFAQMTAATEVALGVPIPSRVYFPIGRKLWRIIGGFALAITAILALAIAYFLALYALGFIAQATLKIPVTAGTARIIAMVTVITAVLIGYGGLLFLAVRLLFLLAPASVNGHRLGVARSWALTRGNFWRALLVSLAVFIPFLLIHYVLQFSLAGFPPSAEGANAEVAKAVRMAWDIRMLQILSADWFITVPVFGLLMLFYLGAGCAAQAFAFRKLTEDDGLAPIAGDSLP